MLEKKIDVQTLNEQIYYFPYAFRLPALHMFCLMRYLKNNSSIKQLIVTNGPFTPYMLRYVISSQHIYHQ